jgi:hypothetical protein
MRRAFVEEMMDKAEEKKIREEELKNRKYKGRSNWRCKGEGGRGEMNEVVGE